METTKSKNKISTKNKLVLGSVGALAFILIAAGGSLAKAATTNTTASSFLDRVAQLVGVDSSKLKSAVSQTSSEEIDKKLAAGEINQDQATKMKADITNGNYFGGFGRGHMGGPRDGKGDLLRQTFGDIAKFLGLTEDQLMTKHHDESKSLLTIAKEQGKSEADLKNYLSDLFDKNLATAVTNGDMTQAQADTIKENKDNIITDMMNHTGFGGGHRGGPDDMNNTPS